MTEEQPDLTTAYASYDGFLKTAIKSYWEKGGDRANFIALLLASREAWEVAWDEVRAPGTGRKVLMGAGGAAAVVVVLRLLLGGPIGLVLTGASIASLGALYARNHRRIWAQQERYKALIGSYRVKHQQVRAKYVDGNLDEDERDLMIDGLLRRFLDDVDELPPGFDAPPEEPDEPEED
ncbi:MAG TPA: hypothetical protein RMH99_17615 [Sandaracinaceae bacterium LLY-WYZ-13_1]|nr:hypothetical protein [Sandaracinaceae bacterium LLY-WYZ-13_1]